MKKKPRKKAEPKPETPPTYQDVVKKLGWGQGDSAMPRWVATQSLEKRKRWK